MLAGEFLEASHFSSISRMLALTDGGRGLPFASGATRTVHAVLFLRSFHDVVSVMVAIGKGLK